MGWERETRGNYKIYLTAKYCLFLNGKDSVSLQLLWGNYTQVLYLKNLEGRLVK